MRQGTREARSFEPPSQQGLWACGQARGAGLSICPQPSYTTQPVRTDLCPGNQVLYNPPNRGKPNGGTIDKAVVPRYTWIGAR